MTGPCIVDVVVDVVSVVVVVVASVVTVDVISVVLGVVGDSVQLALPVLHPLQLLTGSIICAKRKHSRFSVR